MKGGGGISPPGPPISALPRGLPRPGLGCDPFRGEPAITGLDWSFAPTPGSGERIARQPPLRASTGLSPGFALPRGRSPGFRSRGHDSGPFQTPRLAGLSADRRGGETAQRAASRPLPPPPGARGARVQQRPGPATTPDLRLWWPAARMSVSLRLRPEGLKLAVAANSPARDSRRSVGPWHPSLVLPRRREFLREGYPSGPHTLVAAWFQALFTPLPVGAPWSCQVSRARSSAGIKKGILTGIPQSANDHTSALTRPSAERGTLELLASEVR